MTEIYGRAELATRLAEVGALQGRMSTDIYDIEGAAKAEQWGLYYCAVLALLDTGMRAHMAERHGRMTAASALERIDDLAEDLVATYRSLAFASPDSPDELREWGAAVFRYITGDLGVFVPGMIVGVPREELDGEVAARIGELDRLTRSALGTDAITAILAAHGTLSRRDS